MTSRIAGILALVASLGSGVVLVPSCSSDPGGSVASWSTTTENARIQEFITARYTPADVQHTYRTKAGETIDCIDFFAYPSVKDRARRGHPITTIPVPPRSPRRSLSFNTKPNADIDENGNARACSETTVGIRRITSDDIRAAGGLDAFTQRTSPSPVRPPRPDPAALRQVPLASTGTSTAPIRSAPPSAATTSPASPAVTSSPLIVPAPDAGDAPYCTEFEVTDLPGFAHVQSTIYPGGYETFSEASATMSINKTALSSGPGGQLSYGDHDISQIWLYSGWAFAGAGFSPPLPCTCSRSSSTQPCVESVEVGTTNYDLDTGGNTELFFIFSTTDGYNTGCWAGSLGYPCNGTGDNSDWIPAAGNTMQGQMNLNSYNSVSGAQYELYTDVEFVSGQGWWVYSEIDDVTTTTVEVAGAWQGYFSSENFTGNMSEGEAQTFQAGGEVYDGAEKGGSSWTVHMGSGVNPADGYPSAAYFHDVYAYTDVYGTIGPVTVPTEYTYNTSEAAGGPWDQYFYFGGPSDPDGYTWTKYATPNPSTIPALWVPGTTIRSTVGANAITIAPVYVYDSGLQESKFHLFVLVAANASGNNREVQTYSSLTGDWAVLTDSTGGTVYAWGITTDTSNGAFWGWTHFSGTGGGQIWTNDGASSISEQSGLNYTSIAAVDSLAIFASTLTDIGVDSHLVAYGYVPDGYWQDSEVDAYQVTADSINGTIYALQSNGQIEIWEGGDEGSITDGKCGGGTITFVQIAAKNNIIYGLNSLGTIFYYTYSANCWSQVGSKTDFAYSIATDNGDLTGVWASDASGIIWTAE